MYLPSRPFWPWLLDCGFDFASAHRWTSNLTSQFFCKTVSLVLKLMQSDTAVILVLKMRSEIAKNIRLDAWLNITRSNCNYCKINYTFHACHSNFEIFPGEAADVVIVSDARVIIRARSTCLHLGAAGEFFSCTAIIDWINKCLIVWMFIYTVSRNIGSQTALVSAEVCLESILTHHHGWRTCKWSAHESVILYLILCNASDLFLTV